MYAKSSRLILDYFKCCHFKRPSLVLCWIGDILSDISFPLKINGMNRNIAIFF